VYIAKVRASSPIQQNDDLPLSCPMLSGVEQTRPIAG
jgi:hypothetical protein